MRRSIFLLLILMLLSGCVKANSNVYKNEQSGNYGSFTSEKTYSFDKKYYALQTVDNDENSRMYRGIIVSIYDGMDRLVFSFSPARAWDFWGICWEKDSYNIWIQSSDTGTYCYRYDNDKWLLDESAEKPDYIITKYEAEESKNNG